MSMHDNSGGFGGGIPPQPDLSGGFSALSEPTDDADLTGGKKSRRKKKVKGEGSNEPRLLSNPRKFAIILAILAAAAIVGLVLFGGGSTNYVAVTKTNVNALSPVPPTDVEVVKMDVKNIEKGAISGTNAETVKKDTLAAITDTSTTYPLYAGQQLHADQFSNAGTTLSKPLTPDERLISMRAEVAASVAGTLKAGDHVDIIAVDGNGGASGVVAQDIEIVKIAPNDTTLNSAGDGQQSNGTADPSPAGQDQTATSSNQQNRPIGGTYVLRVPATLAPTIASIDASASRVFLVYRAPDAKNAGIPPTTLHNSICASGGC